MDFEYIGEISITMTPEAETELDLYPVHRGAFATLQAVVYQASMSISSVTPKTTLE